MTKGDKIKEVENSINMYEKDIEECNETSKELLEKELEEKQDMLKELQSLTDEEFEYYMLYKLPLDKEMIKNGVEKSRKIRSEMADIPESHVHIGLSKKDIEYLNGGKLPERTTEREYDSKVVNPDSADYSERKFTEGELKCLNNSVLTEWKNGGSPSTEKEKEKHEIYEKDEEKRLSIEKYKMKKLYDAKSINDLRDIYSIDEPFMNFYYLCTLPDYFDVKENEVVSFYANRKTRAITLAIRESVGKYQIAKLCSRLKHNFFEKLFSKKIKGEEIVLRHLSKNGDVEYTEVFKDVTLIDFNDQEYSYNNDGIRTIYINFKYKTEKIYKKFDLCGAYGLNGKHAIDQSKIEKEYSMYSEEQLNEVIAQSEVESNIILAKQELEKREKALKEKVKRCNEISNKADNYLKSKSISSVLDENNSCKPIFVNSTPKNSEMEEGAVDKLKENIKTIKLINRNLANVSKILIENNVPDDKKFYIVNRFDKEAKTTEQSDLLYKEIVKELKDATNKK